MDLLGRAGFAPAAGVFLGAPVSFGRIDLVTTARSSTAGSIPAAGDAFGVDDDGLGERDAFGEADSFVEDDDFAEGDAFAEGDGSAAAGC